MNCTSENPGFVNEYQCKIKLWEPFALNKLEKIVVK